MCIEALFTQIPCIRPPHRDIADHNDFYCRTTRLALSVASVALSVFSSLVFMTSGNIIALGCTIVFGIAAFYFFPKGHNDPRRQTFTDTPTQMYHHIIPPPAPRLPYGILPPGTLEDQFFLNRSIVVAPPPALIFSESRPYRPLVPQMPVVREMPQTSIPPSVGEHRIEVGNHRGGAQPSISDEERISVGRRTVSAPAATPLSLAPQPYRPPAPQMPQTTVPPSVGERRIGVGDHRGGTRLPAPGEERIPIGKRR